MRSFKKKEQPVPEPKKRQGVKRGQLTRVIYIRPDNPKPRKVVTRSSKNKQLTMDSFVGNSAS